MKNVFSNFCKFICSLFYFPNYTHFIHFELILKYKDQISIMQNFELSI